MAGIDLPKNYIRIGENLVFYVEDFHGKKVNIRKTYSKDNYEFVGKGLCISNEDWNDIVSNIDGMIEHVEKEIK